MDSAYTAVAQMNPTDESQLQRPSEDKELPYHTRYYQQRGRRSMKEKAQSQQYLTPPEEEALVDFILRMGAAGTPICVKYIPGLVFCIALCIARRRTANRPSEPPKKNWPQAFLERKGQDQKHLTPLRSPL
jgi:hypothetical protein